MTTLYPRNLSEGEVRKALKDAPTVMAAAVALGISKSTLYRYIRRYGIRLERIVT